MLCFVCGALIRDSKLFVALYLFVSNRNDSFTASWNQVPCLFNQGRTVILVMDSDQKPWKTERVSVLIQGHSRSCSKESRILLQENVVKSGLQPRKCVQANKTRKWMLFLTNLPASNWFPNRPVDFMYSYC